MFVLNVEGYVEIAPRVQRSFMFEQRVDPVVHAGPTARRNAVGIVPISEVVTGPRIGRGEPPAGVHSRDWKTSSAYTPALELPPENWPPMVVTAVPFQTITVE